MKCRNCKNNTLLDDGEQFSWCEILKDNLDNDEERFCSAFSQATNADRIRAMSDDELVSFLYEVQEEIRISFDERDFSHAYKYPFEKRTWVKWLKQESKE